MRTLKERFDAKLSTPDPVTGCIEWTGSRNNCGYGRINVNYVNCLAHRIAYELEHGPIPDGGQVLHRCDNPSCCNPAHLFLGTHADNMKDRTAKGRYHKQSGEMHWNAKLTDADVSVIRKRLAAGETLLAVSSDYGVRQSAIWHIKHGRSWAHV